MPNDWKKFVVKDKDPSAAPTGRRGLFNYGPNALGLRRNIIPADGPDEFVKRNAGLFATGTTSRDEGYFYWGLLKKIGPEREPGINGRVWYYQSKVGQAAGSAIVDFVIEGVDGPDLGIRIVTVHFHEQAGARKRASDFEQQFFLLDNRMDIVDKKSSRYINDPTGRAVIKSVLEAMNGQSDVTQ